MHMQLKPAFRCTHHSATPDLLHRELTTRDARSQIVLGCQLCPAPLITPAPTAEALSIAAATGQIPTHVFESVVQPTISMPAIASTGLREACNILCFTVSSLCGALRAPADDAKK
jgi:hypothetical protein